MESQKAVLETIQVLEDHPDIQMIEYNSGGTHIRVERIPPKKKPTD